MDLKGGGCCVARYGGGGGGGGAYDLSRMDRIMLRFRPIAPKPVSNSSGSSSSGTEKDNNPYVKSGRGKRRYVKNNNNRKKKNDSSDGSTESVTMKTKRGRNGNIKRLKSEENESRLVSSGGSGEEEKKSAVVTLSLLPETPESAEKNPRSVVRGFVNGVQKFPTGFSFGGSCEDQYGAEEGNFWLSGMTGTVAQPSRVAPAVVSTWVYVESITETWENGFGYGGNGWFSDRGSMLMDLENDTCPGFISDGLDKVVWVNNVYREMVAGKEDQEVLIWLVMKGGIFQNRLLTQGFTCNVRVVTCGKEKSSRTLPCDVWRLEGGRGFAWRLDVKAALSLGR
ncbi:OLC1v1013597C1 [Oldenlandia corymbosa var. corymbosa]|uniref:OLC1v1013597C1 n=1 Tax=Oldenlandia corymbosa var. corymbosa TaxID=529605 RepID=A0AAV1E254_OLDCO|nr:OLC1v1013597C1 [Oldenlandia corymbosa var. corymbosa]